MPWSSWVLVVPGTLALAFVESVFLAAFTLWLRGWRNARLIARDHPPYKDCLFPWAVVWLATVLGAVAAVLTRAVASSAAAPWAAAVVAPVALFSLPIGAAITAALRG